MATFSDETDVDVDRLCDQGDEEFNAGHWRQAIAHYEKALEFGAAQMPLERRIDVRMALAVCFFFSESYEDVVEYDRATLRILEAEPEYGTNHKDTVDTRYRLARALVDSASKSDRRRSENWEEAVTFYKKNIRVADKEASLRARKGLASVHFKLRQYSEAKDIYEQLLNEENPNFLHGKDDESLELKHEYAAVQYHLKRYDQSKMLFSQIEETISSLPNSRKRKLGELSQDVDKYLAACVEATSDIESQHSAATTATRKGPSQSSPSLPPIRSSASTPNLDVPLPALPEMRSIEASRPRNRPREASQYVVPVARSRSTHSGSKSNPESIPSLYTEHDPSHPPSKSIHSSESNPRLSHSLSTHRSDLEAKLSNDVNHKPDLVSTMSSSGVTSVEDGRSTSFDAAGSSFNSDAKPSDS